MFPRLAAVLLALATLPFPADLHAQASLDALRTALLNQPRILQSWNGASHINWRWNGTAFVEEEPLLHMPAIYIPSSVDLSGDKLLIKGNRTVVVMAGGTLINFKGASEQVIIEVALAGTDLSSSGGLLIPALFFRSREAAFEAIPLTLRQIIPFQGETRPDKLDASCDCAQPNSVSCAQRTDTLRAGMKPPSVKTTVEPDLTVGIDRFAHGQFSFTLIVTASGKPTDLWSSRRDPLNQAQSIATAVSQYTFNPATCHGRPVDAPMSVSVRF